MERTLYVIRCGIPAVTLIFALFLLDSGNANNLKAAVLATLAASLLFVRFQPDKQIGNLIVWATLGILAWLSGWHWMMAAADGESPTGFVLLLAWWSGMVILAGYFLWLWETIKNKGSSKVDGG